MFSTLATAVSGMGSAQIGLSTTGHNIANVGTQGYSRQRIVQTDSFYRTASITSNFKFNQVGYGTTVRSVQQIRNEFLDRAYRKEATKLDYYEIKSLVGEFVENTTGELAGATSGSVEDSFSIQDSINRLWDSMQEAVQYPESLDKRASLVSNSVLFMDRMSNAWREMTEYQQNLDKQVRDQVNQINMLTTTIKELNQEILAIEASGDSANDYRDSLNLAIEDLNKIVNVRVEYRQNGNIDIYANGQPLISEGMISKVGLKYTDPDSGFVEPVFTGRDDIIPYSEDAGVPLFPLIRNTNDNDNGSLRALLVTRGLRSETFASNPQEPDPTDAVAYPLGKNDPAYKKDYTQYRRDMFNITEATLPKAMKRLDTIFHRVVSVLNDAVAPIDHDPATAPTGIDGSDGAGDGATQFFEIFSRIATNRYNASDVYNAEDGVDPVTGEIIKHAPGDYPNRATLYSIANVQVNPALLELDGYKKIPLSANGDLGNPDAVVDAINKWYDDVIVFDDGSAKYNISDGYNHVVSIQATELDGDRSTYESQYILVTQLDNNRQAVSGVSNDEEMSNMLKYQRSYQASARVINIVDSMIDTIINGMI